MRQIGLLLTNTISLIFALVMNALAGSGVLYGKSVGDVSAQYDTLFAPAGYAFAIWGLIYLLLILFVGYQWFEWIKYKQDKNLTKTGFWFAISNLANGIWIFAWLSDFIGFSVILMLILLFTLIVLTVQLRLELWDAPLRIIAFVWWPVCIYTGWIIVATVANISAFLVSLNWNGSFLPADIWTIVLIFAATLIYLLLIYFRNMREAAVVGVWALIAIAVKQWHQHQSIVVAAIVAAVILFIAVSVHGFKNRATSPFVKMKQGAGGAG
jgi:hypothetical protein